MHWNDPEYDFRYGSIKRHHDEIGVITDLFSHAYSIFRIFSGDDHLHLDSLNEDKILRRAWLRLRDENGGQYDFYCDKQSVARERILKISGDAFNASVDFSSELSKISINEKDYSDESSIHMTSTLRLELGAFLFDKINLSRRTPITMYVEELLKLQADIEKKLS